jgi:hypothetical protein
MDSNLRISIVTNQELFTDSPEDHAQAFVRIDDVVTANFVEVPVDLFAAVAEVLFSDIMDEEEEPEAEEPSQLEVPGRLVVRPSPKPTV